LRDIVRIGDHATVVEKGQRRQRSAEHQAVDVDERQDTDDVSISTGEQIDRFVAERPMKDAAPRPHVVPGRIRMACNELVPGGAVRFRRHGDRR